MAEINKKIPITQVNGVSYGLDLMIDLYNKRDQLSRAVCIYGKEKTLRHFKARFELQERK